MRAAGLALAAMVTAANSAGAPAQLQAAQAAQGAQVNLYEIELLDSRPDRAADAFALLSRYAVRTAAGCQRVDLVRQSPPSANHFAIVVEWRDVDDRNRDASSAAALTFRASFQPLAASPVDERLYARTGP